MIAATPVSGSRRPFIQSGGGVLAPPDDEAYQAKGATVGAVEQLLLRGASSAAAMSAMASVFSAGDQVGKAVDRVGGAQHVGLLIGARQRLAIRGQRLRLIAAQQRSVPHEKQTGEEHPIQRQRFCDHHDVGGDRHRLLCIARHQRRDRHAGLCLELALPLAWPFSGRLCARP